MLVWNKNSDKFCASTFTGDREIALEAGYVEITEDQYQDLLKHKLCWDEEGQLVENWDNSRDDGTEVGLIVGDYRNDRTKAIVDSLCSKGIKTLAVNIEDILSRDLTHIKFVIKAYGEVANQIEANYPQIKLFNSPQAIMVADDKWFTYQVLEAAGVEQPLTSDRTENISYPMVIKAREGSLGNQVYLANNLMERLEAEQKLGNTPLIYQSFIEDCKGKDICVYMVGTTPVASMLRVNEDENEFRSHVGHGAAASTYKLNKEEKALCKKIVQALNIDFCSINLLPSASGTLCLEINSNPGIKVIEEATGIDVVDKFTNYIKAKIQ